jgi:NADH dehydrogenase FAD-containing subunit
MEISKALSINTDYKDQKAPLSWQTRFFAEVIIIDKTHSTLHPLIYQLKDGVVPTNHQILYWKSGAITLPDEAFVLVGEALIIDKQKKQIQLTNNNTIAYNYLIIASGTKPEFSFESKKFLAAIQTLIDAIRVKQKIPSSFAKCIPMLKSLSFSDQQRRNLSTSIISGNNIKSVAQPHICQTFNHNYLKAELRTINKRLYEVHL